MDEQPTNTDTACNSEVCTEAINDLRISSSPWSMNIAPERACKLLAEELRAAAQRPDFKNILAFKKRSMLHADVLIFLRYLAAVTTGPIVEFGAYIGGSTTMLAKGVEKPRKLIVLEPGGSFLTHPDIPSNDIYADLENTLHAHNIIDRVALLKMASWEERAKATITEALQGERISMLCIDSDGNIDRDIQSYRPLCAPHCILIIDDYVTHGVDLSHKSDHVQPYITQAITNGELIQFGIYGWGTWLGRFA